MAQQSDTMRNHVDAPPSYLPGLDPGRHGGGTLTAHDVEPTIEAYENIFGPSARNIKDDLQRFKRHGRWHLPDILKGPNQYLTDRIDGLITDAANSIFTSRILPYQYTTNVDGKIKWNVWSFDEGLASRVPYESAARVLTQHKTSYAGYMIRQGMALVMEHNFMMTPQGRENFRNQLMQLKGSIQLTNDLDVHMALILAESYEKRQKERFLSDDRSPSQTCRQFVELFGFVQKNANALDILIEEAKEQLRLWGGPMPDFMLCNSKLTFSLTMTPERTSYITQGAEGPKRLRAGPDLSSYRGIGIVHTRAFSMETGAPPRDVLRRRVRVAEYYRIRPSERNAGYRFQLYNEERDTWSTFTFADLLRYADHGVGDASRRIRAAYVELENRGVRARGLAGGAVVSDAGGPDHAGGAMVRLGARLGAGIDATAHADRAELQGIVAHLMGRENLAMHGEFTAVTRSAVYVPGFMDVGQMLACMQHEDVRRGNVHLYGFVPDVAVHSERTLAGGGGVFPWTVFFRNCGQYLSPTAMDAMHQSGIHLPDPVVNFSNFAPLLLKVDSVQMYPYMTRGELWDTFVGVPARDEDPDRGNFRTLGWGRLECLAWSGTADAAATLNDFFNHHGAWDDHTVGAAGIQLGVLEMYYSVSRYLWALYSRNARRYGIPRSILTNEVQGVGMRTLGVRPVLPLIQDMNDTAQHLHENGFNCALRPIGGFMCPNTFKFDAEVAASEVARRAGLMVGYHSLLSHGVCERFHRLRAGAGAPVSSYHENSMLAAYAVSSVGFENMEGRMKDVLHYVFYRMRTREQPDMALSRAAVSLWLQGALHVISGCGAEMCPATENTTHVRKTTHHVMFERFEANYAHAIWTWPHSEDSRKDYLNTMCEDPIVQQNRNHFSNVTPPVNHGPSDDQREVSACFAVLDFAKGLRSYVASLGADAAIAQAFQQQSVLFQAEVWRLWDDQFNNHAGASHWNGLELVDYAYDQVIGANAWPAACANAANWDPVLSKLVIQYVSARQGINHVGRDNLTAANMRDATGNAAGNGPAGIGNIADKLVYGYDAIVSDIAQYDAMTTNSMEDANCTAVARWDLGLSEHTISFLGRRSETQRAQFGPSARSRLNFPMPMGRLVVPREVTIEHVRDFLGILTWRMYGDQELAAPRQLLDGGMLPPLDTCLVPALTPPGTPPGGGVVPHGAIPHARHTERRPLASDMEVVIVRPNIEHYMLGIILGQGGGFKFRQSVRGGWTCLAPQ